jgi:lipopolysaccharide biosynthesis protein
VNDLLRPRARTRLIALYLPQFHPIPENDRWWGPGFTEWTNVAQARPLFPGHEQPRLPGELGFYDLRLPETRAAQAALARDHGVEGFCYWHYWFGGTRLLERPFEEVLASGEPAFPFCLGWANQTWSGIWHGAPDRILIEQRYPGQADHEAHFRVLLSAFEDRRYITVGGAPLLLVFQPRELPDARRVTDLWRELALRAGLPGLHLVALAQQDAAWDPAPLGFDAVAVSNQTRIAGPPSAHYGEAIRKRANAIYARLLRRPLVYRYEDALRHFLVPEPPGVTRYPCVIPGWDNTPRSGIRGVVLAGATPALFAGHVREAVRQVATHDAERRIVFIKSWNEWAEGNYLEPDRRWGRAFLEAMRDAVAAEADDPALARTAR